MKLKNYASEGSNSVVFGGNIHPEDNCYIRSLPLSSHLPLLDVHKRVNNIHSTVIYINTEIMNSTVLAI